MTEQPSPTPDETPTPEVADDVVAAETPAAEVVPETSQSEAPAAEEPTTPEAPAAEAPSSASTSTPETADDEVAPAAADDAAPEAPASEAPEPGAPEPGSAEAVAPDAQEPEAEAVAQDPAPAEQAPVDDAPAAEPPAGSAAVEEAPAGAAAAPRPSGAPRPTPRVLAATRPAAPRPPVAPAAAAAGQDAPEAAAAPAVPARPASDPTPWGRVAEDGTVFVRTTDGEREAGPSPEGASPEEALAHYGRGYDELVAQLDLVEQRLGTTDVAPADAVGTLRSLRSSLATAAVVGDLQGLAVRTNEVEEVATARRVEVDAARAEAREQARSERTAVVEEAEKIAGTEPAKMQWRPSGDRLRTLLDTWKELQRTGAKLDKRSEDELWKRFSAARTGFDRARRAYFATLESTNAEARAAKQALVEEAEAMSTSTDWGHTASGYRQLMDRWRAAGHASRKDDDALWARFRAAQDAFFAARHSAAEQEDADYSVNLVAKEALLVEAEALLPVTDVRGTKAKLRDLQERWEAAGKVPRADIARVEKRLRAVEQAVVDAEDDTWRKSNPETRARAEGAIAQLERAVADLQASLEKAEAKGDERKVAEARGALEARQAWLDQARLTAQEFSG